MYKAKIAKVSFGDNLSVEGLLMEDGSNSIAVSQFAEHFLVGPNNHTKQVKALLGNDCQLVQVATELNPKKVNVMSLKQFEIALAKLDRLGNLKAQAFRDALVGLSLQELFNDAFGKASDEKTRQAFLNSIADLANPWEKLVEKKTCAKIQELFSNWCGETFWWTYVYDFLTIDERVKLDTLNPVCRKSKQRKTKIHQWITTEDAIRDRLGKRVGTVVDILHTSTSKQDFRTRMSRLDGFDQKGFQF